jgi:hypothetical protein
MHGRVLALFNFTTHICQDMADMVPRHGEYRQGRAFCAHGRGAVITGIAMHGHANHHASDMCTHRSFACSYTAMSVITAPQLCTQSDPSHAVVHVNPGDQPTGST